jgi:hypothetical protein
MARSPVERWLWYASRTPRCVSLDNKAYPSTIYDGEPVPWPDWACRSPDGGIHPNNRRGRIDIEIAGAPEPRDELSWTCNFAILLIERRWLGEIRDLIDESRTFLGEVRRAGKLLPEWSTLHEADAPPLMASEGRAKTCPNCGAFYTTLHGRLYFSDWGAAGRPLIVNGDGIFVREDLAISRNLRTPAGAYKPTGVVIRASL